jgi:hypothetical protein
MAVNIFERYGIKEVANVYFEALDSEPEAGIAKGDIVLYLDTLKVSTVETTAENVSAQGGWGNPKLVTWDYGKDINVTLEDAVISWEEMRILMGALMKKGDAQKGLKIRKNALVVVDKGVKTVEFEAGSGLTNKGHHELPGQGVTAGKFVDMTNGVRGVAAFTYVAADEDAGTKAKVTVALTSNNEAYVPNTDEEAAKIRLFWEDDASEEAQNATELVISPDRYPGTYRVVGDSLIRSEKTGKDEAFQFVINKAKMLSEVTLTMQAEGDPSTFNMTLNVLRDDEGNMMSLVKY